MTRDDGWHRPSSRDGGPSAYPSKHTGKTPHTPLDTPAPVGVLKVFPRGNEIIAYRLGNLRDDTNALF